MSENKLKKERSVQWQFPEQFQIFKKSAVEPRTNPHYLLAASMVQE